MLLMATFRKHLNMAFEWKDIITPVVTFSGVWLGARFALGNDIRKKSIEMETERLERLSVQCDLCLRNINLYCMRLARLLHDLSNGYKKRITLAEVTLGLKKSAEAGTALDLECGRVLQNTLEFHRDTDFQKWKSVMLPLLKHIDNVIASPSLASDDCTDELSRQFWEPEQVKHFNKELAVLAEPLPEFRKQLLQSIANDHRMLLNPANLNFWILIERFKHIVKSFFQKPTVPFS